MASTQFQIDKVFRGIRKKITILQRKVSHETADLLKDEILSSISQGKSPVSGEGPYDKYSPSYRKQILSRPKRLLGKRLRPINLSVTGKMLKSIKVRVTATGFTLWFSSPIAKYHNDEGAGASKTIRKMLPGAGEKFSLPIRRKINLLTRKIKRRLFK